MQDNHRDRRPTRSIDGVFGASPAKPHAASPRPPTQVRYRQDAAPKATPINKPMQKPAFWKRAFKAIGQTILFVLLLAVGLIIQSPLIGQAIIILYAIAALIWHIRSRTTFFLVLGCFMVVLFASARSDITLASTFAMYALLLLIIGTISLAFEVRSEI
jgi:hypothetical protein